MGQGSDNRRADEQRFTQLVDQHARVIAAVLGRICRRGERSAIPDIEQELKLALWKRIRAGGEIHHPLSYVHRAALTTAVRFLRRQRNDPTRDVLDDDTEAPTPGAMTMQPVEARRLLEQLLRELPKEQRQAVQAYLAGFNHIEVAKLHGWSESQARHRIYRGMERLRRQATGGEGS